MLWRKNFIHTISYLCKCQKNFFPQSLMYYRSRKTVVWWGCERMRLQTCSWNEFPAALSVWAERRGAQRWTTAPSLHIQRSQLSLFEHLVRTPPLALPLDVFLTFHTGKRPPGVDPEHTWKDCMRRWGWRMSGVEYVSLKLKYKLSATNFLVARKHVFSCFKPPWQLYFKTQQLWPKTFYS